MVTLDLHRGVTAAIDAGPAGQIVNYRISSTVRSTGAGLFNPSSRTDTTSLIIDFFVGNVTDITARGVLVDAEF